MCGWTGLTGLGQGWKSSANFSFTGGVVASDPLAEQLQTFNREPLPRHLCSALVC